MREIGIAYSVQWLMPYNKTQDMHVKMREMLARFLLKNKLEFQPFQSTPVEDHVQEIRHERIWEAALELLAVASLMQFPVYTYILLSIKVSINGFSITHL